MSLLRFLRIRHRRDASSEGGQVIVMGALFMVILVGFVALGVDTGVLFVTRANLNRAADAGSLAGAFFLPEEPAAAESTATTFAIENDLSADEVLAVSVGAYCDGSSAPNNFISVRTQRDRALSFMAVLGVNEGHVESCATAMVGTLISSTGLAPWLVEEDAIDFSGEPTVLKYDANNGAGGNFGAARLDAPGSSEYGQNIREGSEQSLCALGSLGCDDPTAPTEPGNKVGDTRENVTYLFENTSASCDEFDEVFNPGPGGYYVFDPACDPFNGANDSLLAVLVPVIDELCSGQCDVTVLDFAIFFLLEMGGCTGNSCEVTGVYVPVLGNFGGGVGDLDPEAGIRSVRLVN